MIIGCFAISGCGADRKASSKEALGKEASYAMGMDIGTNLRGENISLDLRAFTEGVKDAIDGNTRYTLDEAYQILNNTFDAIKEKVFARNMKAEIEFLAENNKKSGVIVTDSGLQYEVLSEGDGPKPDTEDIVKIHYEASLIDGTVFESSWEDIEPLVICVHDVFPGLTEGLKLMNTGSKYRMVIPSELAYGEFGRGADVPPYSPLIFEVELFSIEEEYPDYYHHEHDGHSH